MKIIRGTLFGGITYFLLGWLVWGILLMDFYTANYNQVMNRPETDMVWWAMIVSNLATALLLTLILKWSGAKGIMDGLKIGAIVGLLFSLSIDLSFYSMTTMFNGFSGIVVDLVVNSAVMAVIGLVIVLTWGKEKTT
jgi:hypothetical protein